MKIKDKCCVVTHRAADIRVAWLVYSRMYCVPIATLNQNKRTRLLYLGRDAQIMESLNTARKWEWSARISEVGFLPESLGWARIKCLLSALTNVHAVSIYQNLSETSMERSIEWRTCSIWHKLHSLMLLSPKFKMVAQISPWITWNRWFLVKTRKSNNHASTSYLFKFHLFLGSLQRNARQTCVH